MNIPDCGIDILSLPGGSKSGSTCCPFPLTFLLMPLIYLAVSMFFRTTMYVIHFRLSPFLLSLLLFQERVRVCST